MRQPGKASRIGIVLVAAFVTFTVNAHHSRAAFDTTKELQLEGTVTNVLWANPPERFLNER